MENYILKLNSGTEYKLYKGATLVSDSDLTTLFGVAGEMYLSFDFNSGTPSDLTTLTITDSSDIAVISSSNLTDTIAEGKNYKAAWSNSATTFDTFKELEGKALDESQLSFLMGKIKEGNVSEIKELTISNNLNMWDSSVYPDGLYKITYNGSGYRSIYLSDMTGGKGISLATNSTTIVYLGTNGAYGHRFLAGFNNKGADGNVPLGMLTILYATSSSSSAKIFDGATVNNLTYNNYAYSRPLDANQGKVLADRIGDPTALTTTAKTSTVAAINEVNAKVLTNAGAPTTATVGTVGQILEDTTNGKLYICTDATNPYVWEEVGAGGGGGGGGGEVTEIQLTATTVIRDLITGGTIDKTGRYLLVNDTANNITLHANTSTETTDLARIDAGRQAILDVVLYERNSEYVGYYYAVLNYRDNNGGHSLHFTQYTVPGDRYNTFVDTGSFVSYLDQNDYSHAPSSAVVWTQIQQATIGVPLVIMAASDNDTSTGFHVNTAYGRQFFIDNFMFADVKPVIIQIYIGPNSAVGLPEGYYRFEVSGRSESGDIYLAYTHYDGTFYGGICSASSQMLEFTVTKH